MKVYNKIVRDNIINIMIKNGAKPVSRILTKEEALIELNNKLQEELNEYLESGEIIELIDIVEVIKAITELKNITPTEFEKQRKEKVKKKGAFTKRIYLEKEL